MNADRRKKISAAYADFQKWIAALDTLPSLQAIHDTIEALRDEEQEARDALPESLQEGERGQAMQDSIDYLDSALDKLDDMIANQPDRDICEELLEALDNAGGAA